METHKVNDIGDCFEIHGRFILNREAGYMETQKYTLVHGMVHGRGDVSGFRFAHCWLEHNGNVLDISNGNRIEVPISIYYALGGVNFDEVHKYNNNEVACKLREHEHWGCWDFVGNTEKI